jgi:membrane-bound inhibitor of C-type lysozyme
MPFSASHFYKDTSMKHKDMRMKHQSTRSAALIVAGSTLLLGACSSFSVWPFSSGKEQDVSRTPPGATAYACEGGTRLFVRYLDNGAAAWVILPEREFRLDKTTSTSGTRYTNGNATLDIKDGVTTLSDGAAVTYAGCKASGG